MNYHCHLPYSSYPSWSRAFISPETPRSGLKQGQTGTELHFNNLFWFPYRFPNQSQVLSCLVLSIFIRPRHVVISLRSELKWLICLSDSVLPLLVRCKTRCPHLQAGVSPRRLNPFEPKAVLLRAEQEFGCGAKRQFWARDHAEPSKIPQPASSVK